MHINNFSSARADSFSDSDKSVMITRRKKAKTDVFRSNKSPKRLHNKHHGIQRYCLIWNKAGMPERKYTSHSAEYFIGARIKRLIKDVMVGTMVSRNNDVQQYKKSKNKWKKELKDLKKQNKMLYSISNKSDSRCDIKNINKIRSKYSKKTSESSSDDLESYSLLARDSSWETYRWPAGRK